MNENWLTLTGVVERGHRVASQKSENYPLGTIEMQAPVFKELGLDLTPFHWATLNISIYPHTFSMQAPQILFRGVRWTSKHPPEDFSFSRCRVIFEGVTYEGLIYYPHPETKRDHFQNPSIVEVLAPYISGIRYGDLVQPEVNTLEVTVNHSAESEGSAPGTFRKEQSC